MAIFFYKLDVVFKQTTTKMKIYYTSLTSNWQKMYASSRYFLLLFLGKLIVNHRALNWQQHTYGYTRTRKREPNIVFYFYFKHFISFTQNLIYRYFHPSVIKTLNLNVKNKHINVMFSVDIKIINYCKYR